MSFSCPIRLFRPYGSLEAVRVDVPLTVLGPSAPEPYDFVFDTGCEITMVSEDVATELGLPVGGRTVTVHGLTTGGTRRLVDVRFRFPRTVSGSPGLEVSSTWVVISSGRTNLALLGFREVERHFCIRTLEFDMYFIPWATIHGWK
jgi:hypothetical protein